MASAPKSRPCTECARLREQETAAHLTGDWSRRSDVRVLARRHVETEHPERLGQRQGAA